MKYYSLIHTRDITLYDTTSDGRSFILLALDLLCNSIFNFENVLESRSFERLPRIRTDSGWTCVAKTGKKKSKPTWYLLKNDLTPSILYIPTLAKVMLLPLSVGQITAVSAIRYLHADMYVCGRT